VVIESNTGQLIRNPIYFNSFRELSPKCLRVDTENELAANTMMFFLKSQDREIQLNAAGSLARSAKYGHFALPVLLDALKTSKDSESQSAALLALWQLGENLRPRITTLEKSLKSSIKFEPEVFQVLRAAVIFRTQPTNTKAKKVLLDHHKEIVDLLEEKQDEFRVFAIEVLSLIEDKSIIAKMQKISESDASDIVRDAAHRMVNKMRVIERK
jgi:hypothetical protein